MEKAKEAEAMPDIVQVKSDLKKKKVETNSNPWTINRKTLPLKIILFLFCGAMSSILPYLTIHMQEIGITIQETAIIYAVLPFTSFLGPPLIGFLADRIGQYKIILILSTIANGLFHTLLLAVPIYSEKAQISQINLQYNVTTNQAFLQTHEFQFVDFDSQLCHALLTSIDNRNLSHIILNSESSTLTLTNCTINNENAPSSCSIELHKDCLPFGIGNHEMYSTNLQFKTGELDIKGNNALTFWLYFLLRILATMFMGSCFSLLDATTLAMIKEMGEVEYGKERIFSVLGYGIVSPIAGLLVDTISRQKGYTDYSSAFYLSNVMLLLNIFVYFSMELKVEKPDKGFIKNIKALLSYPEVSVFLFMIFMLGNMWGFVESYLFIFLKELNAPNYLLGLTLTVGSIAGIPFSYGSEKILNFFGRPNIMAFAFIAYFCRFLGYSYITSPFWCFPFEAMEAFTYHLMWISAATYCSVLAPKGLLATLSGVMGSLHYSLGKGNGAFIGGYLMGAIGTRLSFRYFGLVSGIFGLIYFLLNCCWLDNVVKKRHNKANNTSVNDVKSSQEEDEVDEETPALHVI